MIASKIRYPINHLLTFNFPFKKLRVKKAGTSEGRGSMINQKMQPNQGGSLWFLNPGCLIDRLLDRIEEWSGFVLPAKADPSYRAEIEARVEQLGV